MSRGVLSEFRVGWVCPVCKSFFLGGLIRLLLGIGCPDLLVVSGFPRLSYPSSVVAELGLRVLTLGWQLMLVDVVGLALGAEFLVIPGYHLPF